MQCPRCGANTNPGAKFCPNCALDLTQAAQGVGLPPTQIIQPSVCPNCGANVSPTAKFCAVCAAPVGAATAGGFAGNQGYPDQGYAPAYAPRSSNKMPLIIGAIVLVLLIGGGLAAYFLLKDKSSSDVAPSASDTPVDVVRKAFVALQNRDADTFKKLSTQRMAQQYDTLIEQMQKQGVTLSTTDLKQGETRPDGKVVVLYKMTRNGRTEEEDARVVKENDAWKLDNL